MGASAYPQNPSRTPLTSGEVDTLLADLQKLLANPDCASFIESALEQLKTDTGRSQHDTNDIVDISNRQACSDAFKKYGLKIPYDVAKSGKLRIAGLMALNQPNAGELLEWTPSQVDKARATFEWHWYHYFRKPNIGEGVYAGIPTIVFNAYADFKQLGGLREVVTHAFIHVGGKRGETSASPHDLGNFNPGYKEIIDSCK